MVKMVYLLLDDGDNRFLQQYDLTQVQFYALQRLADRPKMLSQLSKELLCDPSNITRVADILERKGLITRQRDDKDRRITWATLTHTGQTLCDEVQQAHNNYTQQRLNILNPAEQSHLNLLLDKLGAGLNQQLQSQTVF
jgi:MarR family 2-MHQ and catechol resistance regulon transcriptional repressor